MVKRLVFAGCRIYHNVVSFTEIDHTAILDTVERVNPLPAATTKVVFYPFDWLIKSQLLGMKSLFKQQDLQIVGVRLNEYQYFSAS